MESKSFRCQPLGSVSCQLAMGCSFLLYHDSVHVLVDRQDTHAAEGRVLGEYKSFSWEFVTLRHRSVLADFVNRCRISSNRDDGAEHMDVLNRSSGFKHIDAASVIPRLTAA